MTVGRHAWAGWLGLAPALLAACVDPSPEEARRAWLVDALMDDNRVWASRDVRLLEEKFARMDASQYDFVRGTAGVFVRDLARAGTDRVPTAFLAEPEAWSVLIAGDPHPENLGTFLPGEGPGPAEDEFPPRLALEINDLDGAAYGPYLVDVRRAQLGLAALLDEGPCPRACRAPVLEAHARAYVDELRALEAGTSTFSPLMTLGNAPPVVEDLFEVALEAGAERTVRERNTTVGASGRRFRLDDALDEAGSGLLLPTIEEEAQLERLLAQYEGPDGFRVLDVARRFGVGVASLPAVRYVVAWDRGSDNPDDDELLAIREVVDTVGMPHLHPQPTGLFEDQADRIVTAHRQLWSSPDVDVRLDALVDGATTFKVLTWSSWNDALDHVAIVGELRDGDLDDAELAAFGDALGRQLAGMHARAPLAGGGPALAVLRADIRDRDDLFVAERVAEAEGDLGRARRDHQLFQEALVDLGLLLGMERLVGLQDPVAP